jgi:gliding motility-associated-like protein
VNATIVVLGVNPQITQPLLCYGDQNGVLTANPTGASGIINYNYSWSTSPAQQTQTISNLSANTYTVTVSANNTCPASASITLIEPDSLKIALVQNNATCNLNNGSISANVTGGTGIYLYSWSNNESTSSIHNLFPGNYHLVVEDAHGCMASSPDIYIGSNNNPLNINLGTDTIICNGESLKLYPGNFAHYLWQDQSTFDHYIVTQPGTYSVEVINDAGCKARDEINVVFGCNGIYFPNSFTPDGDNLNDDFGVLGDRLLLRNFSLSVFNRWGQKVFYTTNPFIKWNGMYKGKRLSLETFVWISAYQINGIHQFRKGVVNLLE